MKFSFKFSNLLGTLYRKGNLVFSSDGYSIISPVGNRLTLFDLKNNKSSTLSLESRYNYTSIALSPNGSILIAVNEKGEAQLISMVSCTVIHRHKFQSAVQCVMFSPDGRYFAAAKENLVFVFSVPGELTGEYNPFVLHNHFIGGYDNISWMDWSSDSRFLAIGCRDNSTKICGVQVQYFKTYVLSGHTDSIVSCFFEDNSMHLNTLSRNGQLCLWECSLSPSQITELCNERKAKAVKKKRKENDDSDDDIENTVEKQDVDSKVTLVEANNVKPDVKNSSTLVYKKLGRYYLADEPRKEQKDAFVTASNYNRKTKVLVVAFSTGSFYLYELPEVNMIHSLNISDYPISAAAFNGTGDWLALASSEMGQLLVWEWQSEQYIMKQQSHSSEMTSICYSPDGKYIATGGHDGKVKLWNSQSGFCFVTFSDHSGGITAVQFSRNKKFLISSSVDGTVRAFDITRYRNFRTFTSPRPVQFACVAIDFSGELVAAGGQDVFEIYLWSVKLGQLLEIISGHEGPVSSVVFSPVPNSSVLVSGSWDKTIKIWNCLENNSEHETIDLLSDVVSVAYHPNGEIVAAATLNGNISIFELKTSLQINSIEGRNDLTSGRSEVDVVTAKKNAQGKYFSSIEYSPDGNCILAGGNSRVICIYHAVESVLLKKIEITTNHSLDGLEEYINRRNMSEFGNMSLVEYRDEHEGGNVAIKLPGVQKGDMAARSFKPEVKIFGVKFSPTAQAFAVASNDGLCIYSLDNGVVFDPLNLTLEVTPKSVNEALQKQDYSIALIMALKLNENDLTLLVLESVPFTDISLICAALPNELAQRLLKILPQLVASSQHIEFFLQWSRALLTTHGNRDIFEHHSLLALHESVSRKYEILSRICDFNKYTMGMLMNAADKRKQEASAQSPDHTSEDELLLMR